MKAKEKEGIYCPICGREEHANINQDEFVMCSWCLMQRAIALEQAEKKAKEESKALPHEKAIKHPKQSIPSTRICKKCGGSFHPKSNRQEFCSPCGKSEKDKNNRERQKDYKSRLIREK